tara:strand:+ start:911 stop:1171 length:261 start_codon:yes stop_codon:yes gene_type:complete
LEDIPLSDITINDLRKLIKEELEVVLTNDEVKEFFDVDVKQEINEELDVETEKIEDEIKIALRDEAKLNTQIVDKVMLVLQGFLTR